MKPKIDAQVLDERLKASLQKRWPAQPRDASQVASIIASIDSRSRKHPVETPILSAVRLLGLAALLIGLIVAISLSMRMLPPTPASKATETPTIPWQPIEDCFTARHEIQPGDTLSSIAANYNVPPEEIAKWNGFGSEAELHPGSELVIPLCKRGTPEPTATQAVPGTISPTETAPSNADNVPVLIKFVAWEYQRPIYEPLMAKFHEAYPSITVEFVTKSESDDEARLHPATGDVVLVYGSRSMEKAYPGYYRSLSFLMDADPDFHPEDFWTGALDTCTSSDGHQLGIPLFVEPTGIFYHKQAFDAAGVPYPRPGWTWDDMRQAITALAKIDGDVIQYGFAEQSISLLNPLIENLAGQNEIDAQAIPQEIQWYIDLVKARAIYYPTLLGENGQIDWEKEWQTWQNIFSGEHPPAMWIGPIFASLPGQEWMDAPSDPLAKIALGTEGFVPFPIAADGTLTHTSPLMVQCAAISDLAQHPGEAWLWINFLSHQRLITDENNPAERLQLPARRSVAEAHGYWDGLSPELREVLEFSVAHAHLDAPYTEKEGVITSALEQTLLGQADFAAAVEAGLQETTPTTTPSPTKTPQAQTSQSQDNTILVVRSDENAADPEAFVSDLGYKVQSVSDGSFRLMTIEQLLEYPAVFYFGTTPSDTLPFLTAYLDAGGSLYIADHNLGRNLGETDFYKTYLQATYQENSGGDLIQGEDIMETLGTVEFVSGVIPDGFTVGTEGTRIFQYTSSGYAAGVAVNRNGYKAVYTAFDSNDPERRIDTLAIIREIMKYLLLFPGG
ncbi:MAG: extracellular solute-binding protein [Chloroflexota bacterium]